VPVNDATVREHRRRLHGVDMVVAVGCPRRAHLGALVDGAHCRLPAVSALLFAYCFFTVEEKLV